MAEVDPLVTKEVNRKLEMSLDDLVGETKRSRRDVDGGRQRKARSRSQRPAHRSAHRGGAADSQSAEKKFDSKVAKDDKKGAQPAGPAHAHPSHPPMWGYPPPHGALPPFDPRYPPMHLYPPRGYMPPPGYPYAYHMPPASYSAHPGPHGAHAAPGHPQPHHPQQAPPQHGAAGGRVQLVAAAGSPPPSGKHGFQIRLSNAPPELGAQDLAEAFLSVSQGRVESVDVLRDTRRQPTGEVVVIFSIIGDAHNAVNRYNGGDLNGRRLIVVYEGEVVNEAA